MSVHTQREYDEKSAYESQIKSIRQEEIEAEVKVKIPPAPVYVMLHPENERDNLKEFVDMVTINGKEYKRECVRGIVRTDQEELKEYLFSQGYLLLDIIQKENDNG